MRRALRALTAGVMSASTPSMLAAQYVRGVVRDSVAATPIAGAVVSVVDSSGATAARTLAGADGRFSLVRSARAARLRVVRIGYTPRDLPLWWDERDGRLEIAMLRIPPVLDAVRVNDVETCPGASGVSAAFSLWEQARAGLLASVVTSEANPAAATTTLFERRLSPEDGVVQTQKLEIRNGRTARPFRASEPAATFAVSGYMREDSTGRAFGAPDAEVLLDETFAATHCFRLQSADALHDGEVGVAFSPASGRDTLVEVAGVIWIDQATPAVRSLDFRYVGLEPAATRADAGGEIVFRTMPNGASFVERWNLRIPILARLPSGPSSLRLPAPGANRRQAQTDVRVREIEDAGGQVTEAAWRDGTNWRELPSGLGGVVAQQTTNTPIAGVLVSLAGTSDAGRSDAQGQFTIAPVIPGRYTMNVVDTSFGANGRARRWSQIVDVMAGSIAEVQPRLPAPPRTVIAGTTRGPRVIQGTVLDGSDQPVRQVNVVARDASVATVTDDSGRFRLRLPSAGEVILDARRVGFIPSRFGLGPGGDTTIVITMLPAVQALEAVHVTATTAVSPNLRGFEQRLSERTRGTNSGYFVTTKEIEQRSPVFATQLFEVLPAIRVLRVGRSGNRAVFGLSHGTTCPAAVFVDGVKISEGGDEIPQPPGDTSNGGRPRVDPATGMPPREPGVPIDQLVLPWDIAGIEVYPSANRAPPQFQALNGGCAVVVIWTKHGA